MESINSDLKTKINNLIRNGQGLDAQVLISKHLSDDPQRSDFHDFANFAWRSGVADLGVKLLNPIVRNEEGLDITPTDEEILEYGVSLIMIGAIREGAEILDTVSEESFPRKDLYKSFALFSQWRYREAIPCLERYISRTSRIGPYQTIVGQINLAASLIFVERYDEAFNLLQSMIANLKSSQHSLLYGNCLELLGQTYLFKNEWGKSTECLEEASKILSRSGNLSLLFVKKWRAISEMYKHKKEHSSPPDAGAIKAVKKQALAERNWETARQCDYYSALITGDYDLMSYNYFGTPFVSLKDKIKQKASSFYSAPAHYYLDVSNQRFGSQKKFFDLNSGQSKGFNLEIREGGLLHNFLKLLLNDFYVPVSESQIFANLFPGEFYNPHTSPLRVQQVIHRAREWIKSNKLPITIVKKKGACFLTGTQSFSIRIPEIKCEMSRGEIQLKGLSDHFQSKPFTNEEACKVLNISARSCSRLLLNALENSQIKRSSQGRKRLYFFSHKN